MRKQELYRTAFPVFRTYLHISYNYQVINCCYCEHGCCNAKRRC